MTVIDPRHPLYPQTFRLLGITTKQHLGRCCVVLDHLSRERLLPIAVTDRSSDPLVIASLPVNLTSLQEVILVFTRIQGQRAQGATNVLTPTYNCARIKLTAP